MASSMLANKRAVVGAFGSSPLLRQRFVVPARVICNSYKNLENINLSRVPEFAKHEKDTGSSEYQVARLTARVQQLSAHLQVNKKDFGAKRGLQAILAQRRSLLQYLYRTDRESYYNVIGSFGIRSVVVGDTRGTSREKAPAVSV